MPKFEVDIPHSLPVDEVKTRIGGATSKIESKYGAECKWVGDRQLTVSRKGLDATLTIEPTRVHVDISLGFLLTPMASPIKAGLAKELAGLLAAPSATGSGPATT
ncbi:MAG TPA: polyhydroxyalkanoic acid system family protein [Polyangia bacterium]|jgi:putative polyhydroxyalkanoate system protein